MLTWLCRNIQDRSCRFCAWKFRTSVKISEDIEASGRVPKFARLDLQDLLFEELPRLYQLRGILTAGLALLKGAHVKILKEYDQAFLNKVSHRFPFSSGLRGPNAEEMEYALEINWRPF